MNKQNVIKLWKAILKLSEIATDKAVLIVESELTEGVEVFVEKEGEYVPAEDGEYVAEDKVILVEDGKVVEIRNKDEKKPDEAPEDKPIEEVSSEDEKPSDEKSEDEPDEKDSRIAELEAKVDELDAMIAERDARIAELEAMLSEKQEQLEMSAEKPAKEKVKNELKSGAMRYFN